MSVSSSWNFPSLWWVRYFPISSSRRHGCKIPLFPTTESKEIFLCFDTTTDADPQIHRSESTQDIFFSAPESLIGSFISLSRNQHPQQTLRKLLFYFRILDFTISRIPWSSALSLQPTKPKIQMLAFSRCQFHLFGFREFRSCGDVQLCSQPLES